MAGKKKASGRNKLWVICARDFEYNDEIHSPTESGGGRPLEAFSDEVKAEASCKSKNFQQFLNILPELGDYCYDVADIFNEEALSVLAKHGTKDCNDLQKLHWQTLPPEDVQALYDGCSLSWYHLYEVDEVHS